MRLLLLAVVMAQALDAATFAVMPRANEVNPLVAGLHTEAAWLAKALLVVLVVAIDVMVRNAPAPKYEWVGELSRTAAELVAIVALAAGCIGAGSNIAVLSSVGA